MKKFLFRIITIALLAMLIAVNVTSTMKFAPGGGEANAAGLEMTCWSQVKEEDNVNTVWCSGCQGLVGYKDDGGKGSCIQQQ
ncbi:MAG: hypothetical protein FH748_10795 [Balneolaceae bacterium]|nr:hypothetical protein [Balneolaceae bacterium]